MTSQQRIVPVAILEGIGCGGCAREALAALNLLGVHSVRPVLVEAPAHADVLLLCGAFPPALRETVHRLSEGLSTPWRCIRLGDCADEALWETEQRVPGCPPNPEEIFRALTETEASAEGGQEG